MWPNDADGDVLRRLEQKGFDFSKPHMVDFNVDFEDWPPAGEAVEWLKREYPSSIVHSPTEEMNGYVQFQVFEKLSYELVTGIQSYVTEKMSKFGGYCESWGVLH